MSSYLNFFFPLVFLFLLIIITILLFKILLLSVKKIFLFLYVTILSLLIYVVCLLFEPFFLISSNLTLYFQPNLISLVILTINLIFILFLLATFAQTEFFFYTIWLLLILILGFHLLLISNNLILLLFCLEFVGLTIIVLLTLFSSTGIFANNILNYFLLNSLISGFLYFIVFFFLYINHYSLDYLYWYFYNDSSSVPLWMLFFVFLFKLGVAPVHVIQISVYERLPWYIFFFLLKIYKFVLFIILCKLVTYINFSTNLFFVGLLSMIVGALQPYWSYSLRNLLFASSLFIYGSAFLLLSVNNITWALGFIFIYTLFSTVFFSFIIFFESKIAILLNFLNTLTKTQFRVLDSLFFFSGWFLSGIPPTIFFFLKSSVLNIFLTKFGLVWVFLIFLIFVCATIGYFRLFKIILFDTTFGNIKFLSPVWIWYTILPCCLLFVFSDLCYTVILYFFTILNETSF